MSIANRMDTIESIYDAHEGNIHYIMNNYDLDGDDFDFLVELKSYKNG